MAESVENKKQDKDKKPQVNITFKKKEMDIYMFLKGKSSPANFIKDLVRAHMSGVVIPTGNNNDATVSSAGNGINNDKPPKEDEAKEVKSDIIVNGEENMDLFIDGNF